MAPLATKMSRQHEFSLQERQVACSLINCHFLYIKKYEASDPERWRIPFKLNNRLDENMLVFYLVQRRLGSPSRYCLEFWMKQSEHYVGTEGGETTGNWRKQMPESFKTPGILLYSEV
jgi:hypothetical protein